MAIWENDCKLIQKNKNKTKDLLSPIALFYIENNPYEKENENLINDPKQERLIKKFRE
jgi:hypothetical protein